MTHRTCLVSLVASMCGLCAQADGRTSLLNVPQDGLAEYSDSSYQGGGGRGILSGVHPHVYIKSGGMITFPIDTENENRTVGGGDDVELRSDIGGGWYAAAGIRLGPGPKPWSEGMGFRLEAEVAQRFFSTDGLFRDDVQLRDLDGDLQVTTIMGNVLFDITVGDLRGYSGIGLGYADVEADVNGFTDSDSGFAIQLPIGFETQLVPHVWLDTGVRFLYIPNLDSMSDLDEYRLFTTEIYAGITLEL
ncbi:MAG: outer membrane beta-barrel protein [Planctomycetota bacterium]